MYKYKAGLNHYKPIDTDSLIQNINTKEAKYLQHVLYENAITLVQNNNDILPLQNIDKLHLASLSIGDTLSGTFSSMLSRYARVDQYFLSKNYKKQEADSILKALGKYEYVIVALLSTNNLPAGNFGIIHKSLDFIDTLQKQNNIILNVFANPYTLSLFKNIECIDALILSYQNNIYAEELSAQLIFGGIASKGKLPVTVTPELPLNTGIQTDSAIRLKYTLPRELNISENDISKIDSIALNGIKNKAYPGCVVLVAKDGKVFYNKAFGYHTYDKKLPLLTTDIFDVASITKIEATTMAIMKLYDEGKIILNKNLEFYLPYLNGTNKGHIVIKDVLAHQAKLKAWIPFYLETIKKGIPDPKLYSKVKSKKFPFRVADSLYVRKDYPDTIMKKIIESPLNKKKEYLYSDLGFYLLMKIVEKVSGQDFYSYLYENFYKPLGMANTGFRPRERFKLSRIIPTEIDYAWRKQLVIGDVNDQGAALLGGISGHAGLFSNAYDMAALMQMLLQKGEYANKRYFKASTVDEFTKCQFPSNKNRRGLGFDKPTLDSKEAGPCCKSASALSYGHSGDTGTYCWVDP
ncbi:MAG: serine hydrolase, partial [Bacteroidetes bacterium]|nr:serine hydrolase [Bacteroidota bacterium]